MTVKYKTIGEMPKEMRDIALAGDPTENPDYEGRMARAELANMEDNKRKGITPEAAYPRDPKARAAYRKFLKG